MPRPSPVATVLVVDDEENERSLMGEIIQRQSLAVVTAGTCSEARATFDRHRETITLLVADISLPDGNGFELAIALRKYNPGLRVLFVSGHVGAEVRRFYGPEIQDFQFLAKPFTASQLSAEVHQALRTSKQAKGESASAEFTGGN